MLPQTKKLLNKKLNSFDLTFDLSQNIPDKLHIYASPALCVSFCVVSMQLDVEKLSRKSRKCMASSYYECSDDPRDF